MNVNYKSRKFWIAILSDIIALTVVVREIGGKVGIIASIVCTVASAISYMITEYRVDPSKIKMTYDEVKDDIEKLKEGGE